MNFDQSFEIENTKGDRIKVALSYYDAETLSIISSDPDVLTLVFYNVALNRESGDGHVGPAVLNAVSKFLGDFILDNEDAVLCFLCDSVNEVPVNRRNLKPHEFRSTLFSRMFDRYVKSRGIGNLVNRIFALSNDATIVAHFFCRKEHLPAVVKVQESLLQKP